MLSIIVSITIYVSLNVVSSAKQKSYEVTITNIEKNANTYVAENNDNIFYIEKGNIEYQCITVGDLIEMGYLTPAVINSKVGDNETVSLDDYIYIERDKNTKTLQKSIYDNGKTYQSDCNTAETALGDIVFTIIPDIQKWSKSKDITITYKLRNYHDININDYKYTYVVNSIDGEVETNNNASNPSDIQISKESTINAKILDKNNKAIVHKTIHISKLDNEKPIISTTKNNPPISVYGTISIPINLTDTLSGINHNTVEEDDFEVTIDDEKITSFKLNKENNNYTISINDKTHPGEVKIKIAKDKIFDNAGNGNEETILIPGITMNAVYEILDASNVSKGYAYSLSNALSKSSNGYTIKALVDNTSETVTNTKNVTLDTNSKTITLTGTIKNNSTLTINGGGKIITQKNIIGIINSGTLTTSSITIDNSSSSAHYMIQTSDSYILNNGTTITNNNGYGIALYGGNVTTNNGTKITTKNYGIKYGFASEISNGTITINGGTIATNDYSVAINSNKYEATMTMTGGSIIGKSYGIYSSGNNSTTININNGLIQANFGVYLFNSNATLTLGTNNNDIKSNPHIISTNSAYYAVYNYRGTFNWYDGELYGKRSEKEYYKDPDKTPTGYGPATVGTTEHNTTYKSYLSNIYIVTANANGGNIENTEGWTGTGASATKNVVYNTNYGTLPTPTRVGYTFKGWYTALTGGTKIESTTKMTTPNNQIIYAQWEQTAKTANYKVNHYIKNLDNAQYTLSSTETKSGTTDIVLKLSDLKKSIPGYTYDGGYTTGNTIRPTSDKITTTTILEGGNRVINLYYRQNRLTIKYNANGGKQSETHGSSYGIETNGDLYYIDSKNNKVTGFIRGIYGSNVGLIDLNGDSRNAKSGLDDYNLATTFNIEKEGYIAKAGEEWNTKADGTGTSYDQTSTEYVAKTFAGADLSKGDVTINLYVNWVKAPTGTCKLIFNKNLPQNSAFYQLVGNPSPSEKTVNIGSTYGTLQDLGYRVKDGVYIVFAGWGTQASGGPIVNSSTKCTSSGTMQLYAHWTGGIVTPPVIRPVNPCIASAAAAKACMEANSAEWWEAKASGDQERMDALHDANIFLSDYACSNCTYNNNGYWYNGETIFYYPQQP